MLHEYKRKCLFLSASQLTLVQRGSMCTVRFSNKIMLKMGSNIVLTLKAQAPGL